MRCVRCKAGEGGLRLCPECRSELRQDRREPAEVAVLFEEGATLLRLESFSRAAAVLERLLKRDPKHLGAYESIILCYGYTGKYEPAVAALAALHRLTSAEALAPLPKPTVRSRTRRGRAAEAPPETETLEEAAPPRVEQIDLINLALFYRQLGHLKMAEAVLQPAMENEKSLPEAHLVLGSTYREQGRPRLALRHLKAAQGGQECAAVHYETGLCLETLGQLKKAHAAFTKAVTLEPDNPHMHLQLGMVCEKLGRARQARRSYKVASVLNAAFAPALVDISFRLGLEAIEEGHLDKALQEFQAGMRENEHLFSPTILQEIDHLLVHIIRGERFRSLVSEHPSLRHLSGTTLRQVDEVFTLAARLAFYVGLSYYWDGSYEVQPDAPEEVYGPAEPVEDWQYESVEPEATWLEGPGPGGRVLRGATTPPWRPRRRPVPLDEGPTEDNEELVPDETASVRAEISRAQSGLGFPPVPFEFIFEEWLHVHSTLFSPRVADRPLVSPDTYHRLMALLGACKRRLEPLLEKLETVFAADIDGDDDEPNDISMWLWATIIESFLVRMALERCRAYPRDFLVRFNTAERYRQRRFFTRAIRELETALSLMPESASLYNILWNLYIREGRFAEAAQRCQEVLRFTPHHLFEAAAYNDMAYCMVEQDEDEKRALLFTEKARELAPRLFDMHVADTVAWLHHRHGRSEEALPLIERVIAAGRAKNHPLTATSIHFYHYGHILTALGRSREAEAAFATAVEMELDAESDWGIARRLKADFGRD